MRLTNIDRDAFIKAVLDDVPSIDYQEQARVALQKKAVELLPPKLRTLHKEFGHWFKTSKVWNMPHPLHGVYVVSLDGDEVSKQLQSDVDFWGSVKAIAANETAQSKVKVELRAKLHSCIYACQTSKQARERMPEFAKYLPPDDDAPSRTLPVVANVVADLVAAGWPKDKKVAKGRKAA